MNARSRYSLRPALGLLFCGGLFGSLLMSCGPPDGAVVIPEAVAGCEDATDVVRATNAIMLPGRNCAACHKAGGQATNSPWTVSGTVFADKNSPCNPGGLNGMNQTNPIFIELQDKSGMPQVNGTFQINSVGNFYSSSRFVSPIKARIYELGPNPDTTSPQKQVVTRENCMIVEVGVGSKDGLAVNCALCHQFPPQQGAPGRLFLDATKNQCPNPFQPPAM